MIETIQRMDIKSKSPYIKILKDEIFPTVRKHLELGSEDVMFREKDIRNLLKIDDKVLTLSIYNRLKILSKPEFDVSMGTHKDGSRLFIFYYMNKENVKTEVDETGDVTKE